jgi:hypothetical protein
VVRGHGWLKLDPHLLFAYAVNFVNCARAIADIHRSVTIESHACRNPKISDKGYRFPEWVDTVHSPIHPTGNEHLSVLVKSYCRWVGDVTGEFAYFAVRFDTKQRYW